MTSTEPPEWLRDRALAPLWERVRSRLEQNGLTASGSLRVTGLDRASRHAIGGLLGRTLTSAQVTVDLAELDESCRSRAGLRGLVAAVEMLTGSPLTDRRAKRDTRNAERELPYAAARTWCRARGWTDDWLEKWLNDVRLSGVLTRAGNPPAALTDALNVLARIAMHNAAARTELAAAVLGNAHALDDGTVVAQLVLRALSCQFMRSPAVSSAERRLLWAAANVRLDAVSTSLITLNVRPVGRSPVAQRLRSAAESGDPMHISAWELARCSLVGAALGPVLVCENPRVLEALAEAHSDVTVVCGFGQPTNLVIDALRMLREGGAHLRYHGDFDWPGLRIANRLMVDVDARPWLMVVADYEAAARVDGPKLVGDPVDALWEPALRESMLAHGVAVHEEAVLPRVLSEVETW